MASVLIVDDSRLSRVTIKRIFNQQYPDWQVVEADGGEQALERSAGKSFDVITIDYNMPGMDGLTLAKKLKEFFPETKMAMLSANIQNLIKEEARDIGLTFIEKPVTSDKVSAFIES